MTYTFDEFIQLQEQKISELYLTSTNKILAELAKQMAISLKDEEISLKKRHELDILIFVMLNELWLDTNSLIPNMLKEMATFAQNLDRELFKTAGKVFTPYAQNNAAQLIVGRTAEGILQGIKDDLRLPVDIAPKRQAINYIKSSAVKMILPNGKATDISTYFQRRLDQAISEVKSGDKSYDDAIKSAVKDLNTSGINIVRYEGKDNKPVNRSIESVVRSNVMTAISHMAGEISLQNAKELGAKHIQVSAHVGARTGGGFGDIADHSAWQGRIYSLKEEK